MFHSIGHEVVTLHRCQVGGLDLGDLPEGEYRFLSPHQVEAVFSGPSTEEIFAPEKKQLSA
jgi:16S rRNA pseudouridine516 synthase